MVSTPNPTFFMRILRINSVTVSARAVAGTPTAGLACIWLMAPSGTGLSLQGSYDIEAPNCGIYVNSPSSNAIKVTGGGGTVNAAFIDVVGTASGNHTTSPTGETLNAGVRTPPWGNLTGPATPGACNIPSALTSVTIANESTVSGSAAQPVICFTKAVILTDGVQLPGASGAGVVYVFEKGVEIATGATVKLGDGTWDPAKQTFTSTSGAVMELQTGTLTQDSNSLLSIYAPTGGTYNGIAILQPSTNTTELQIQFGSNNEILDGYIYAPGAEVFMQDHGGGVTATGIVASYVYEKSSTLDISNSYDTTNSLTTLNRVVTLLE
jgi:hypothetical protein